jgi:hypothetical protein
MLINEGKQQIFFIKKNTFIFTSKWSNMELILINHGFYGQASLVINTYKSRKTKEKMVVAKVVNQREQHIMINPMTLYCK